MNAAVGTGREVFTVKANDEDSPATPGGMVKYRIVSGSFDEFSVGEDSGHVTVGTVVPLSSEKRPLYNITVCNQSVR